MSRIDIWNPYKPEKKAQEEEWQGESPPEKTGKINIDLYVVMEPKYVYEEFGEDFLTKEQAEKVVSLYYPEGMKVYYLDGEWWTTDLSETVPEEFVTED